MPLACLNLAKMDFLLLFFFSLEALVILSDDLISPENELVSVKFILTFIGFISLFNSTLTTFVFEPTLEIISCTNNCLSYICIFGVIFKICKINYQDSYVLEHPLKKTFE